MNHRTDRLRNRGRRASGGRWWPPARAC